MKYLFLSVFLLFSGGLLAQETATTMAVDSLYREDQFYMGVTYNLLGNKPTKDLKQNGFSLGFHAGFIRDIPLNNRRNVALGIGLGFSLNSFNQNLLIYKEDDSFIYSIIDEENISFSKNKFSQHLLEIPVEFRWRTSTAVDYKFWRIYAGFKIGYVLATTTKFKGSIGDYKYKNLDSFNTFQYGLSLSAGYNTWNLYFYYALNPIFSKDAQYGQGPLNMNAVKVGLMFYIL